MSVVITTDPLFHSRIKFFLQQLDHDLQDAVASDAAYLHHVRESYFVAMNAGEDSIKLKTFNRFDEHKELFPKAAHFMASLQNTEALVENRNFHARFTAWQESRN